MKRKKVECKMKKSVCVSLLYLVDTWASSAGRLYMCQCVCVCVRVCVDVNVRMYIYVIINMVVHAKKVLNEEKRDKT